MQTIARTGTARTNASPVTRTGLANARLARPAPAHARAARPVVSASASRFPGSLGEAVGEADAIARDVWTKVSAQRSGAERRRAAQLLKMARAIDELARGEVETLTRAVSGGRDDGDIDVTFVDSAPTDDSYFDATI